MRDKASSRRESLQPDAAATNSEGRSSQYNTNDTDKQYTARQLDRARQTLHRAEQWRRDNPQAWRCIVAHALDLASKQQPIAAQALIESVRKKAFIDKHGNDTRTNNSFASVFARWLIVEHPQTAPCIELRRSAFDALGVRYVR